MTKPTENSDGQINSTPTGLIKPPIVEIASPDDRVPTDAEAERALQAAGFTKVTRQTLIAQRQLGVHLKGQGVLKAQRGIAFICQQRLLQSIDHLARFYDEGVPNAKGVVKPIKPTDAVNVAKAIALSVGKMTDSQKFVVSMEQKEKPDGMPSEDVPTGKSFPPGTYVAAGAGAEVHIHGPAPTKQPDATTIVEVTAPEKEVAKP